MTQTILRFGLLVLICLAMAGPVSAQFPASPGPAARLMPPRAYAPASSDSGPPSHGFHPSETMRGDPSFVTQASAQFDYLARNPAVPPPQPTPQPTPPPSHLSPSHPSLHTLSPPVPPRDDTGEEARYDATDPRFQETGLYGDESFGDPLNGAAPAAASGPCGCEECQAYSPCCGPPGCWKSNLVFFLSGDSWANRGDDNHANNFGMRAGVNSGWALDHLPFRVQLGAAWGGYNLFGRDDAEGNARDTTGTEQQLFLTAGIYRRSCVCEGKRWSWGAVYDHLRDDSWGEMAAPIRLGQVRGQLGYAWNELNEIGLRGAFETSDDLLTYNGGTLPVGVLDQAQFYWKRNWESGAETTLAVVATDEPGEFGLSADGTVPLNTRLALYGKAFYLMPSTSAGDEAPNGVSNSYSEETWNVSFGLVFYPGHKSYSPTVSGYSGLPLLPVADNSWLIPRIRNGEL